MSKRHVLTAFSSHFIKALIIFRCIYYYYAKSKVESVFFLFLYILFAIHHSLRCWYLLFKVKSRSRKISVLLFSRIFVYRYPFFLTPPSGRGVVIPIFSRFFVGHLPQSHGFRSAKQITFRKHKHYLQWFSVDSTQFL